MSSVGATQAGWNVKVPQTWAAFKAQCGCVTKHMAVQDMMCREESMETVLRLMCLISLTQVSILAHPC